MEKCKKLEVEGGGKRGIKSERERETEWRRNRE